MSRWDPQRVVVGDIIANAMEEYAGEAQELITVGNKESAKERFEIIRTLAQTLNIIERPLSEDKNTPQHPDEPERVPSKVDAALEALIAKNTDNPRDF